MTEDSTPRRRPVTASCHCGSFRAIVYLTLPHQPPPLPPPHDRQNFYRCNCTTCHKTGIFHTRLASSPDDFLLLSPLNPLEEFGDYRTGDGVLHSLFCKKCGVRCFVFTGQSEIVDVDLQELGVPGADEGTAKAWRPKKDGWKEGRQNGCYLSLNALTFDANQDGVDLTEWADKKWVMYYDYLREENEGRKPVRLDAPYPGGSY